VLWNVPAFSHSFGSYTIYDLLYAKAESLGVKPLREFAADAGVTDMIQFDACNSQTTPVKRVDDDKKLAAKIRIPGTPGIVINGTLYAGASDSASIHRIVDDLLARARSSGVSPRNQP
jgi:protein-disulfide isomerase